MLITLDEREVFTESTTPATMAKIFDDKNAGEQSVRGGGLSCLF